MNKKILLTWLCILSFISGVIFFVLIDKENKKDIEEQDKNRKNLYIIIAVISLITFIVSTIFWFVERHRLERISFFANKINFSGTGDVNTYDCDELFDNVGSEEKRSYNSNRQYHNVTVNNGVKEYLRTGSPKAKEYLEGAYKQSREAENSRCRNMAERYKR